LLYELKSPTEDDLAALAKEERLLKAKMTNEWGRVISSESTQLGNTPPT
jgi:hypothetical protein